MCYLNLVARMKLAGQNLICMCLGSNATLTSSRQFARSGKREEVVGPELDTKGNGSVAESNRGEHATLAGAGTEGVFQALGPSIVVSSRVRWKVPKNELFGSSGCFNSTFC
jgi:hypothetical protein